MAISPADTSLYDEQEQMQIMSSLTNLQMVENDTAADDDDAGLEADLKALRARVAALQDKDDVLAAESWEWTEGVEAVAQQAERMAQEHEAAALRVEAARIVELREIAEDVATAARRLRETDLRRLAADAETGEYNYILILTHEELAAAAKMEILAVGMERWMASLVSRLNRGVAEFAARPGEEAFVAAMRLEAAKAEDARSALARYRAAAAAAAGSSLPPAAGDQMEQD